MPSIRPKINPIDNRKQQSFIITLVNVTLVPSNITSGLTNAFIPLSVNVIPLLPNITPSLANTFGSTSFIYQPIITFRPAQIGLTLPTDLPQQHFNTYANPYKQIWPIKMPNEMLFATIIAQSVKI